MITLAMTLFSNVFMAPMEQYLHVRSTASLVSDGKIVDGMTSVGKTFTMQGGEGSIGLVQLATYDLLRSLALNYPPAEYRVMASYVEIYNEVRAFPLFFSLSLTLTLSVSLSPSDDQRSRL
jgi:hypothetical protein